MDKVRYNWKRFWCPRGGVFFLDYDGFVRDPDTEWDWFDNPEIKPFDDIDHSRCLILLGEPGIGKTCALEDAVGKARQENCEVLFEDLAEYASEDRLINALFRGHEFLDWRQGDHNLHIFLDSLDECKLSMDTVSLILAREFPRHVPPESSSRLYLRIACRTAEWPKYLEDKLPEIGKGHSPQVYELVPLRREDVIEAARAHSITPPENLVQEVVRNGLVPLAMKPITLEFLLGEYEKGHSLSLSQWELYEKGCLNLAKESSESRKARRKTGTLTKQQRLAVVGRIAILSTLCKRDSIPTAYASEDMPGALTIEEILEGRETAHGNVFSLDASVIQETLNTGLFTGRRAGFLGWAHQTYREFLGAWYLIQKDVPGRRILQLLFAPGDPEERFVPEFRELAVWIAAKCPEILIHLLRREPEVLLRCDMAVLSQQQREDLVAGLLRAFQEKKVVDDSGFYSHYHKLQHKNLASQLRPWIEGRHTKDPIVRRVAIDIAEACGLKALQQSLLQVALDISEKHYTRAQATWAVVRVGDKAAKLKLKPLALGQAGDDPYDELKGAGLHALWPSHSLSAADLFSHLTPPRDKSFFGFYALFISQELIANLRSQDLPVALRWCQWLNDDEDNGEEEPLSRIIETADAVLVKALDHVSRPDVLNELARAVLCRVARYCCIFPGSKHQDEFSDRIRSQRETRRKLVKAIIAMPLSSAKHQDIAARALIQMDDVQWVMDQYDSAEQEARREMWANVLLCRFDEDDAKQSPWVIDKYCTDTTFRSVFARRLSPVDLGSSDARDLRESYRRLHEPQQPPRPVPLPLLSPEKLQALAVSWGGGNGRAWEILHVNLAQDEERPEIFIGIMSRLSRWKTLDSQTHTTILAAAVSYLHDYSPPWSPDAPDRTQIPWSHFAGCDAFLDLLDENPAMLNTLAPRVWKSWAPAILMMSALSGFEEPLEALIPQVYQRAKTRVREYFGAELKHAESIYFPYHCHNHFSRIWDVSLGSFLLGLVRTGQVHPNHIQCVLKELLIRGQPRARRLAETILGEKDKQLNRRYKPTQAAVALFRYAPDAGWHVIRPFLKNRKNARQFFLSLGGDTNRDKIWTTCTLSEEQLADLYIRVTRLFPNLGFREGAHFVEPIDRVLDFQGFLIHQLETRGTPQACRQIDRLLHEFPGCDSLYRARNNARANWKSHAYLPPSPHHLLEFLQHHERRFVRSADDLLETVIDSLNDLRQSLNVRDLWNTRPSPSPKDEGDLSDKIKEHLDRDLKCRAIVFSREVQIKRVRKTDLHVTAFVPTHVPDSFDKVELVLEVKGCWHKELWSMESQLVERYLDPTTRSHGLYVVGWFSCKAWDDRDRRKKVASRLMEDKTVQEAQHIFDQQTAKLSKDGITVRAIVLDLNLPAKRSDSRTTKGC
jgi:hypothetical protein